MKAARVIRTICLFLFGLTVYGTLKAVVLLDWSATEYNTENSQDKDSIPNDVIIEEVSP